MKSKLIKLLGNHYIVVDDSAEIKEDRWYYNNGVLFLSANTFDEGNNPNQNINNWLVTHSTLPIEYNQVDVKLIDDGIEGWVFAKIKPLSLSEVEEAVYGFSVEKMALEKYPILLEDDWDLSTHFPYDKNLQYREEWIEGFKAHQELVKDKLFGKQEGSLDDFLLNSIKYSQEDRELIMEAIYDWIEPKTWEIEIVNGKIKLI